MRLRASSYQELLPSFLHRRSTNDRPARLHPTSYLDGLRGIAALVVFFYHLTGRHFKHLMPYYGTPIAPDGSPAQSTFLQLPFLRLIYSGRPMVHIFFIISGYALSLKPLKHIRARQHSNLLATLSSSVFRRGLRLFLPTAVASFISLILGCLGIREMEQVPPFFTARVRAWLHELYVMTYCWDITNITDVPLDGHLWTIPIEMATSMILFCVIIGLPRTKAPARLGCLVSIIAYCQWSGQWAATEFLLGMLLAEIGLIQEEWAKFSTELDPENAPTLLDEKALVFGKATELGAVDRWALRFRDSKIARLVVQTVCALNLIFALWVMGWPDKFNDQVPSWTYLIAHTSPTYNIKGGRYGQFPWFCLGAVQILAACSQIKVLRSILETSVAQYLGKISYALYLLHGSVLLVLGPRVVPIVLFCVEGRWHPQGKGGGLVTWFISGIIITSCLVWAADLFWRFVDTRCVKIAKQVEELFIIHSQEIPVWPP
jgi:peptidoglycan/LPS O-acetylase OafA/YrhL